MSRSQRVLWISVTAFWAAFLISLGLGLNGAAATIEIVRDMLRAPVNVGGLVVACAIVLALTKLPR